MAAADSRDSGAKNKGYLSSLCGQLGLEDLPHPTLALADMLPAAADSHGPGVISIRT